MHRKISKKRNCGITTSLWSSHMRTYLSSILQSSGWLEVTFCQILRPKNKYINILPRKVFQDNNEIRGSRIMKQCKCIRFLKITCDISKPVFPILVQAYRFTQFFVYCKIVYVCVVCIVYCVLYKRKQYCSQESCVCLRNA